MQYHIAGTLRIEAVPSPNLVHIPGCKAHEQHAQTLQSTGQCAAVITAAIARDAVNLSSTTPAATTTSTSAPRQRPVPIRRATEPARLFDTDEAYQQRTSADSLPPMSSSRPFEPSSCIHLMTRPSTERSDQDRVRPGPPAYEQRRGAWLPGSALAAVTPSPKTSYMPRTIPAFAHRRRRKMSQPWYERITEDQALWFLTLPPKVRKQQFSKEEQTLLTQKCEDVLQRASSERANSPSAQRKATSHGKMKKAGFAAQPPVAASTNSTNNLSDKDVPTTRSLDLPASETLSHPLYNRRRASIAGPVTDINKVTSRAQSSAVPPAPNKHRGLPRAMALKPLPLPAPTLAPLDHTTATPATSLTTASGPLRPLSALSGLSQPPEVSRGTSYFSARSTREALPLSMDHSDEEIQSPTSLPQAVEFPMDVGGLPMAELAGDVPSVNTWLASPTERGSFLPQCRPSSPESDQEDDNSLDTEGPTTPSQLDDSRLPPYKSGSVDSGVGLPLHISASNAHGGASDPLGLAGDHEVTLCVRLCPVGTFEQEMMDGQSKRLMDTEFQDDDPLALGALPVCDDDTGAHGAFAIHDDRSPKGLKRVWSSLRRH